MMRVGVLMGVNRTWLRGRVVKQALLGLALCLLVMLGLSFFTNSAGGVPPALVQSPPETKVVDSMLSVVGQIEAGHFVPVSAPFDGVVQDKSFAFDAEVLQGQVMLKLDTAELLGRLNEAKVGMLKARKTLQELQNWGDGAEFSRAQRAWLVAQQQVEQGERKVREAEGLLNKGIISRDEYEGLRDQLTGYQTQMAVAADDLKSTQEKASATHQEIARLEYSQQKAKYDELQGLSLLAVIKAPRSGIVSKLPLASGQTPVVLENGSRVGKGQVLFYVASTDAFKVSAKVNELDIAGLTLGMKALVTLDSKDMPAIEGRVVGVAAQANSVGEASRNAMFDIQVELPLLTDFQRQHVRIGMSCNVTLVKG
jgi:HlyD family secretion protein